MNIHSRMGSACPDCEAIQAIESLCPPTVENGKIKATVQDYFLAARARCFQRTPRIVQPDVYTANHVTADIDVIVFDENEFISKSSVPRQFSNFLKHSLSRIVSGMRF